MISFLLGIGTGMLVAWLAFPHAPAIVVTTYDDIKTAFNNYLKK
jgi:hypothetical protein